MLTQVISHVCKDEGYSSKYVIILLFLIDLRKK